MLERNISKVSRIERCKEIRLEHMICLLFILDIDYMGNEKILETLSLYMYLEIIL